MLSRVASAEAIIHLIIHIWFYFKAALFVFTRKFFVHSLKNKKKLEKKRRRFNCLINSICWFVADLIQLKSSSWHSRSQFLFLSAHRSDPNQSPNHWRAQHAQPNILNRLSCEYAFNFFNSIERRKKNFHFSVKIFFFLSVSYLTWAARSLSCALSTFSVGWNRWRLTSSNC